MPKHYYIKFVIDMIQLKITKEEKKQENDPEPEANSVERNRPNNDSNHVSIKQGMLGKLL